MGNTRRGSDKDGLEEDMWSGPGMRLLDALVGDEARLVARERAGVPGNDS